jgi:pimeloyl-ACP methyl ester carboxylesterase
MRLVTTTLALGLAVAAGPPLVFAEGPPAPRSVKLASGVTLQYVAQGPEDGEAVLMLHGYTDTWFSFSRVLPLMSKSVRTIAVTQRGHGGSDRPASGYGMDDLATDAIQLMDALSIRRATVVGHSMGSFVARRVAAISPDRVTRLVLVGAGPDLRNPAVAELGGAIEALKDPVDVAFVSDFQRSTVHRAVPDAFMERAIADSAKVPARVWKALYAGMLEYRASEQAIRCPTLVIGGDKDGVFTRAEQEELARRIPGAKSNIVPDIGHAPHWEDPESFVRALVAFIEGPKPVS